MANSDSYVVFRVCQSGAHREGDTHTHTHTHTRMFFIYFQLIWVPPPQECVTFSPPSLTHKWSARASLCADIHTFSYIDPMPSMHPPYTVNQTTDTPIMLSCVFYRL